MIDGSHLNATGDLAECGILECLKSWNIDDEALENRMGAAWIKRIQIRDLYVIRIVSFC